MFGLPLGLRSSTYSRYRLESPRPLDRPGLAALLVTRSARSCGACVVRAGSSGRPLSFPPCRLDGADDPRRLDGLSLPATRGQPHPPQPIALLVVRFAHSCDAHPSHAYGSRSRRRTLPHGRAVSAIREPARAVAVIKQARPEPASEVESDMDFEAFYPSSNSFVRRCRYRKATPSPGHPRVATPSPTSPPGIAQCTRSSSCVRSPSATNR